VVAVSAIDAFRAWADCTGVGDAEARTAARKDRLKRLAGIGAGACLGSYVVGTSLGPGGVVAEAALAGAAYLVADRYVYAARPERPGTPTPRAEGPHADAPSAADPIGEAVTAATGLPVESVVSETEGSGVARHLVRLAAPHVAEAAVRDVARLAGHLDVSRWQLRLTADPHRRSARELLVTTYPRAVWDRPSTAVPLDGETSVWDGVPFGQDIDGRGITLNILGRSMIIGGSPDMGKTVTAMTILSTLVRDPRVRVWVADPKGVDTPAVIPVAYKYAGASQVDCLDMLTELERTGQRKLDALRSIGAEKLTRDIGERFSAMDPAHVLASVDVAYLDEISVYTDGDDRALSKQIIRRLTAIAKLYRAAGIVLVLATQSPRVAVIPGDLRDQCKIRIAHGCAEVDQSNTILGKGAAGLGWNAKNLEEVQGVAIAKIMNGYVELRPHHTRPEDLAAAVEVGITLRSDLGTMPERHDVAAAEGCPPILLAVREVFADDDRMSSVDLVEALRSRGTEWVGLSFVTLAARLAGFGVTPRALGPYRGRPNVRGYRRDAVDAAIARMSG
jgi:S-DNA-T family DNA segregation ATPase FtsK/SpoIIIE